MFVPVALGVPARSASTPGDRSARELGAAKTPVIAEAAKMREENETIFDDWMMMMMDVREEWP